MDEFPLGAVVPLTFEVRDADGVLAAAGGAGLTVRKPDTTNDTPTLDNPEIGIYQADYVPAAVGRYIAVATFTGVNAGTVIDVFDVIATTGSIVTLADAQAYLGADVSWSATEIGKALDAERAAQAKACRIDDYGPDLREALLRRVARNLAARAVPVAQWTSFDGGASGSRVPKTDPEIRRLEAPYRKTPVG